MPMPPILRARFVATMIWSVQCTLRRGSGDSVVVPSSDFLSLRGFGDMGGNAGGFTEEEQPSNLFSGAAQRSDPDGRRPHVSSQEAWPKLLANAFPGLAGALTLTSIFPRRSRLAPLGGSSIPETGGLQGPGLQGILWASSNPPTRAYADRPSLPGSGATSSPQRPTPRAPRGSKNPTAAPTPTGLDTRENINELAKIITSEASVGNDIERTSVGFTVLNRMRRNGTIRVEDVSSGYVDNQTPPPWAVSLATSILRNQLADPSNGATHFYSPRRMPKEGEKVRGADTGGGLEQSGKLPKKNYRPAYTKRFSSVKIPNVHEENFSFWRAPGNGTVE